MWRLGACKIWAGGVEIPLLSGPSVVSLSKPGGVCLLGFNDLERREWYSAKKEEIIF